MRKLGSILMVGMLGFAPLALSTGCKDKEEHKVEVKDTNADGSESKTTMKEKTTTGSDGSQKTTVEKETKTTPPTK